MEKYVKLKWKENHKGNLFKNVSGLLNVIYYLKLCRFQMHSCEKINATSKLKYLYIIFVKYMVNQTRQKSLKHQRKQNWTSSL